MTWDWNVKHTLTTEVMGASPLSHDTVMQLFLLFDVGMISTCPLAAFAVVTAENGGQLLLGQPVGRQGNGAFLSQAPAVLHNKAQRKRRQLTTGFIHRLLLFKVVLNLLVFYLSILFI